MEKELQVLIIEDDPADALRLMHELGRCGLAFRGHRVETRAEFLEAVTKGQPDLVLSDHGLPSFSGFAALAIIQEKCPEVPFIFVTGSYDQGMMVEMFESGAAGYVYKNRLSELAPAIEQAIKESGARSERRGEEVSPPAATAASPPAADSEMVSRRGHLLICSHCKKVRNEAGDWEMIEDYLQLHKQATVSLGLCPGCA